MMRPPRPSRPVRPPHPGPYDHARAGTAPRNAGGPPDGKDPCRPAEGGQPAPQKLQSGEVVEIEFNKNEITWSAGNTNVIQTVAYDARGKRLKQDQYTRNKGGKRVIYFWGVPVKFEMDVSPKMITKRIPFDIRQRPVNEQAYGAFKHTIDNQREVVKTIKTIDRVRRRDRSYYGDDLAGLYYYDCRRHCRHMGR